MIIKLLSAKKSHKHKIKAMVRPGFYFFANFFENRNYVLTTYTPIGIKGEEKSEQDNRQTGRTSGIWWDQKRHSVPGDFRSCTSD